MVSGSFTLTSSALRSPGGRSGSKRRVLSKELLDRQLDDYMSMSKTRLDAELDAYMALAGDLNHEDDDRKLYESDCAE